MENENPWEKKNSPSVDQVLEDLKRFIVGGRGGKKSPKKDGSKKQPFSPLVSCKLSKLLLSASKNYFVILGS